MNQVQGKDKSCLAFWIKVNSRAAEIELENKTSVEMEQLLVMAVFLGGTTNEKLAKKLWSAEYDFKKTDDEIKAHGKVEKQHADARKLKGHKESKEITRKKLQKPSAGSNRSIRKIKVALSLSLSLPRNSKNFFQKEM